MTVLCEIVSSEALAVSATPAAVTATLVGTAHGIAPLVAGITLAFIGAAAAISTTSTDTVALSTSTANATGPIEASDVFTYELTSTGAAQSTLQVGPVLSVSSTAAATSTTTFGFTYPVLTSTAAGTSQCVINITAVTTVSSTAATQSALVFGGLELATNTAAATSAATGVRSLEATVSSTAAATDTITASSAPPANLAVSTADASSSVTLQASLQAVLSSTGDALSWVWYKDPNRVAWVMNTETSAASWYNNFDFESIAQLPGKELAVGPDGLYALTGATDAGDAISASLVSGFNDFGSPQTKRLDTLYFGYTSTGQLSVGVETYGSGHAPYVYYLEERDADAPRNSRVTPGKGLVGRYWRTTVRNISGAEFHVYDVTSDIATSARRL